MWNTSTCGSRAAQARATSMGNQKSIPVNFDQDERGRWVSNDETIGVLIERLAEAGLALCAGQVGDAENIYREVRDNAHKADQGTRGG